MDNKYFLILDSSALLYRAYYALPKLTTKKGQLVNAVYGFLLIFFKALKDFHPDFIVAAFDFPAPTFRKKIYTDYKAGRKKMPDELKSQIPLVKKILSLFGIPLLEKEGYEADDIIATICSRLGNKKDVTRIILTGDHDLFQLIDSRTEVCLFKTGVKKMELWNTKNLKEKYGLTSQEVLDFKALRGDSSDNIPGIPGIGPKTAVELLQKFGNLENIYNNLDKDKGEFKLKPSLKDRLRQYRDQAFLSRKLASLKKNLPLNTNLEEYRWRSYNKEKVINVFQDLGFKSLIKRLDNLRGAPQKGDNLKLL